MNRILTVKRGIDTKTISQPLTIYRSSSDGKEDLDGVLCHKSCDLNNVSTVIERDGMTYFVFENKDKNTGVKHKYYLYVYKTDDAYWMVQFGSPIDRADYWEDCYHEWAKSMQFK